MKTKLLRKLRKKIKIKHFPERQMYEINNGKEIYFYKTEIEARYCQNRVILNYLHFYYKKS